MTPRPIPKVVLSAWRAGNTSAVDFALGIRPGDISPFVARHELPLPGFDPAKWAEAWALRQAIEEASRQEDALQGP